MIDAIAISDLHLGSDVCQIKLLESFLKTIHHEEIRTKELILNGDVFDSWNFNRLKKHHWHVLSLIRKMSDHTHVVWVAGNHDGPAEIISNLLGVDVVDEYVIESGGRKILFHHGHRFDEMIDKHPIITKLADIGYRLLMRLDSSFRLAHSAKRASKTFLRNSEVIKSRSIEYADKHGYDLVCAGHTHLAVESERYFNSGCWTEQPCTFLSVDEGHVELHAYKK